MNRVFAVNQFGLRCQFTRAFGLRISFGFRISIFGFLLFSASTLRADLVLEQQSTDADHTEHTTLKLHGDKMRMDEPGEYFSVIVDLNTRDSISLFTNIKKYLKRSGAEIRQQMEKGKQASTNDLTAPPAPAVDTGNSATVNGLKTEIYTWQGANGLVETLWVATNFPDYAAIKPELVKLDKFNTTGPHSNAQPPLSSLPGMVIKSESLFKGHNTTTTLESVKLEPVAPSVFELPSDYTLYQFPEKKPSSP